MRTLLIVLLFTSCAAPRLVETQLYFAQSRPDGSLITYEEWNHFKATHIARVFKEGSTTISATGNWYDTTSHQLITEPTYVVSYVHKRSAVISKQIDSLRNIYVVMFKQQSVLRTDKRVKASF